MTRAGGIPWGLAAPGWVAWAVPLVMAAAAALVFGHHVRAWRRFDGQSLDPLERSYRWRQYRRRTQATGMLVLLTLGLSAGQFISFQRYPSAFVWFWAAMIVLVVWITLLAIADAVSNLRYLTQARRSVLVEQTKLKAQLAKAERTTGNGQDAS